MIRFRAGTVGHTIITSKKRYSILMGGRGGARSYTASLTALYWATESQNRNRVVITRQFEKDIEDSIFREIRDRFSEASDWLMANNLWQNLLDNSKKMIRYQAGKNENTIIPFGFQTNSKDVKTKGKSLAGINKLIMEEAQDNREEDFMRLDDSLRAENVKILLLTNPPHKNHWMVKNYFDLEPAHTPHSKNTFYTPRLKSGWNDEVDFFHKTYLDNPKIIKQIFDKYSNYGNPEHPSFNPDYYYNQIMGLVPAVKQGLVFSNWKKMNEGEVDWSEYRLSYGLDFGYNDPTVFVLIGVKDTEEGKHLIIKELFYKTQLTQSQIIENIKKYQEFTQIPIVADCSRPELIQAISLANISIKPSKKGTGSILSGVNWMQNCKTIRVQGNNLVNEFENYAYKNGIDSLKDDFIDDFNHGIDGTRYGLEPISQKLVTMITILEEKLKSGVINEKEFLSRKSEYNC